MIARARRIALRTRVVLKQHKCKHRGATSYRLVRRAAIRVMCPDCGWFKDWDEAAR